MEAIVSCQQHMALVLTMLCPPTPELSSVGSVMGSWWGSKEAFTPSQHVQASHWQDRGGELSVPELGPEVVQPK